MKWHAEDDDYFMLKTQPERAQLQLAMFAIHLSMGNNIKCKTLSLATIKKYIRAVSSLTALHRKLDIRKDCPTDETLGKSLQGIFTEIKRWQDVPNQREPCTPEMLLLMNDLGKEAQEDSLTAALADWCTCAMFGGFRIGEYGQTESHRKTPPKAAKNYRGDTRGFTIDDFRVQTRSGRRLRGADILKVPYEEIYCVWVRFRTQKNQDNGIERLFLRSDFTKRGICFVLAIYRIIARFVRLFGSEDHTTPVAAYKSEQGSLRLITADDVADQIRALAAEVYHLDPKTVQGKKDLQKWSSHSLRIGACVFLHSAGFSTIDIKWICRWRSDAFMAYLRNFPGLSKRQNIAFANLEEGENNVDMPIQRVLNDYIALIEQE